MRDRRLRSRRLSLRCAVPASRAARHRRRHQRNAPPTFANVRLTKAQRSHIQLYTVVPVGYRQRIEAPGHGRLRQRPGDVGRVSVHRPGDADFRRARAACRQGPAAGAGPVRRLRDCDRRPIARPWSPPPMRGGLRRPTATLPRTTAFRSAKQPRRRPTPRALKPTAMAALQTLALDGRRSRNGREARRRQPTAGVGGIIRAPVSGIVVEKQITPGQLLQAGRSAGLHRRQPFAGLGPRADCAERPCRRRRP